MARPPRILITRSAHQTSALAEALRQLGAESIAIPTISLAPPTSFCALDAALAQLPSFDWLLFTSANAVQIFAERVRRSAPHQWPPSQRVAAIGPATAQALRELGAEPSLQPPVAVAESLAEALLPHTRQPDGSATHMLLVRAEQARDVLPERLRDAGADVTIVPAYRNRIPPESLPEMRTLFADEANWPDVITFTSSSTATNLMTLLNAAGVPLPERPLRASIGPITSATMRALGMAPHLEAAEASIPSLVRVIAEAVGLPR